MTSKWIVFVLLAGALGAQPAKVTPLLTRALTDIPGREGVVLTVEYAPGASSDVHRHNAHVFVYVLEGSHTMQVKGGPPVTLGPGQTFYENPDDIHAVSKNASATAKAKFLVFLVKKQGAPPTEPVN